MECVRPIPYCEVDRNGLNRYANQGVLVIRIVAGDLKGRRISAPTGKGTRPTSDRARAALFTTLDTMIDVAGARFLDLYAGSGAVGLEAMSRGADSATLVEFNARAAKLIRGNASALGLTVHLRQERVTKVVAQPPDGAGYDIVFADPPYEVADSEVDTLLANLLEQGWLAEDAVVVVERSSRGNGPQWPVGMEAVKERRYGAGTLWYGRRS